jgi:hypothetical protein
MGGENNWDFKVMNSLSANLDDTKYVRIDFLMTTCKRRVPRGIPQRKLLNRISYVLQTATIRWGPVP